MEPLNSSGSPDSGSNPDLVIFNVRLPHEDPLEAQKLYIVHCSERKVNAVLHYMGSFSVLDSSINALDAEGSLMLPSLCHAHIHLDKCFILDRCTLQTGDFAEALKVTSAAKKEFSLGQDDLEERGRRLIRESIECGVTSVRAHCEADEIVGVSCLRTASTLKEEFKGLCDIQICAFAQERLFTEDSLRPDRNYLNFALALGTIEHQISVVGSAPYVEATAEQQKLNIELVLKLAKEHGLHADFHLDYNLDGDKEPLIHEVIRQARKQGDYWTSNSKRITIGHATRLQLFTPQEWERLKADIGELPISFVALPNSDLYMMGRDGSTPTPLGAPRGTLHVPQISQRHGIEVAMGVNNVDNAFTPQGSVDPLALLPLGVAIYQTASPADIRTLAQAVTITAKKAIGLPTFASLVPASGDPADFVIMHGQSSLQNVVLSPAYDRTTIRQGKIVSRRRTQLWLWS